MYGRSSKQGLFSHKRGSGCSKELAEPDDDDDDGKNSSPFRAKVRLEFLGVQMEAWALFTPEWSFLRELLP